MEIQTDTSAVSEETFAFEFKGNALEYFRIWIVNVALSILTLGIYSAWAKVRTRRYFDTHTFLAGANFDYHGDPMKILKGRLIIGAILVLYSLGGKVSPVITAVAFFIFLGIYPWIVVRSMAFNLANTSYRGLRFSFRGRNSESYVLFLKCILVTAFTGGLGYPLAVKWVKTYLINNSRYGDENFHFQLKEGESFYWIYLKTLLFGIVMVVLGIAAGLGVKAFANDAWNIKMLMGIVIAGILYIAIILNSCYALAATFNLTVNSVSLKSLKAKSTGADLDLAWLYLTNFFACLFTLGLMFPWAKVRATRKRLEILKFVGPVNSLDRFHSAPPNTPGAGADAAADLLNLDFDLGF